MSSAFRGVPSRFKTSELTLGSRTLGDLCYSRFSMPDRTVCNPAFLPDLNESIFLARVFLGNGYAALNSSNRFINDSLTRETMQSLFTNTQATSLEAHANMVFASRYFLFSFSPYRVQYASEFRNPNFPVVALHASIEKSFTAAGGIRLDQLIHNPSLKDFRVGAKTKLLNRRFVHGNFSLLQAASQSPRDYLPSKKQTAFFIDPELAWVAPKNSNHWRVTTGINNLGFVNEIHPEYQTGTDMHIGVGATPALGPGKLDLGLDLVDLFYAETFADRLRAGASYRYGLIETMVGLNSSRFTTGVQFVMSFFQAGVSYEFIRNDLNDGAIETRISTEFAIQL